MTPNNIPIHFNENNNLVGIFKDCFLKVLYIVKRKYVEIQKELIAIIVDDGIVSEIPV